MKDQRKTEIKVGIMVIAGVVLFLWLLGWTKNFSLTASHNYINVVFDNVSGLEIGDHVTVNGVKKGFVEDFNIRDGEVTVVIALLKEVQLRKDAAFSIAMLDLMGGKKIEVYSGRDPQPLDMSAVHKGSFDSDIPQVMSMFGLVQDDLVTAIKDVRVTLTSLNQYLTDEKMQSNIKNSLESLRDLTNNLNTMIRKNQENITRLTENAVKITDDTRIILSDNKDEISASMQQLTSVLKKADTLLVKMNTLTDEITSQQNNLGRFIYDEKLLDDISATMKQANELTRLLVEQLQKKGIKVDANINLF